jgi:PAS domain S-box-containing protein
MSIDNNLDILRAVIETSPDAIFVKDLDGRYVLINDAAARFVGKTPADIIGRTDFELYPEATARDFVAADRAVLERGEPRSFEGVATGVLGHQAYFVTKGVYRDPDGRTLHVFGISQDVTDLKHTTETLAQTREALFRSQKMEVIGQLTGGISHDFNNILAIIVGNLELLKTRLPEEPVAEELIDTVMRAAFHAQSLTSQLLAFSRRRPLRPQPVDVNTLVAHTVRFARRTLGERIQIATATSDEPLTALVDPAALEAAILNIALNARDAMPDGGTLTFRTSKDAAAALAPQAGSLNPGTYVCLAIEDTGTGMPPEVAARAFEPFFTTKPGGRGTGLGLSMVQGFAAQSGGTVTIQSAVNRGTTVTIAVPFVETAARPVGLDDHVRGESIGARVVLVVEDDPGVRDAVRRQLEMIGHTVIVAASAAEALSVFTRGAEPIPDVLLTDVVLRHDDGIDLARGAQAAHPGLQLLFMSGDTAVPEAEARIRALGAPLLAKPFTSVQLEVAITTVCRLNS